MINSFANLNEPSYLDEIADKIENNKTEFSENLWENQEDSMGKLGKFLKKGKNKGLFIYPGGGGKSRMIAEISVRTGLPTLVLVHQKDEVEMMKDKLSGKFNYPKSGIDELEIFCSVSDEKNNTVNQFSNGMSFLNNNSGTRVIVTTYTSMRILQKMSKQLFDEFFSKIHFIASDEAHESLGVVTKKSYNKIDKLKLDSDENIIEEYIDNEYKRLQLFFTATPQLSNKNVLSHHKIDIIDHYTFGEQVKDGHSVIPTDVNVGNAIYVTKLDKVLSDNEINSFAPRFKMENGNSLYDEISNKYLELKEKNGGVLPAISSCYTIEEADYLTDYLNKKGIRSERVTTGNKDFEEGISLSKAKELIENGKIDNIVTVKKGTQSLNIPILRASMNFVPKYSPKDLFQFKYRITRCAEGKTNENTYNIEPTWIVAKEYARTKGKGILEGLKQKNKNINKEQIDFNGEMLDVLFESKHWIKTLLQYKEINKTTLVNILTRKEYNKLVKLIPELKGKIRKTNNTKSDNTFESKEERSKRVKSKRKQITIDETIWFSLKNLDSILNQDVLNDPMDLNQAFEKRDLKFVKKYGALELIEKVKKYPIDWSKYSFDEVYSAALLNYYEYLEKYFSKMKNKKQRSYVFPRIRETTLLEFVEDYNSIELPRKIGNNINYNFDNTIVEKQLLNEDLGNQIDLLLSQLNEREEFVIRERFYNAEGDNTLEKIGNKLNLTRERVRVIESSAIKRLKHPKVGRFLKQYVEMDKNKTEKEEIYFNLEEFTKESNIENKEFTKEEIIEILIDKKIIRKDEIDNNRIEIYIYDYDVTIIKKHIRFSDNFLYEHITHTKRRGLEVLYLHFTKEYFESKYNLMYDFEQFRKRLGYKEIKDIEYGRGDYNHLIIKASNGDFVNFKDYLGLFRNRYLDNYELYSELEGKLENKKYNETINIIIDNLPKYFKI